MEKISKYFFVIAVGLVLFVICLSAWGTKEGRLFEGILLLYIGVILLFLNISRKEYSMNGVRFRGILAGIMCVIAGIVILFSQ